MTICERLFEELDRRGLTAYGLCRHLGVATSVTTGWKQRGTDPPAKYVVRICEFLGCSISYFLTGSDTEPETKKSPAPGISENGREMLELYEKLPEPGADTLDRPPPGNDRAPAGRSQKGRNHRGRVLKRTGRVIYVDFRG